VSAAAARGLSQAAATILEAAGTRMAVLNEATAAMRQRMRALRRTLPLAVRLAAERDIRIQLRRLGLWRRGRRIAVYLAHGGEVELRDAFEDAWSAGVRLYVPLVTRRRDGRMTFVPLTATTVFRKNFYRIEEPASGLRGRIFLRELDAVMVPTVAFDGRGHRLGMGAGYYDRALRRRLDLSRAWRRPRLVGIAFAAQEVGAIDASPWDVALDEIVTERGVRRHSSTLR
jgi:5-formyltetrahydrofolate cyclo-ligase